MDMIGKNGDSKRSTWLVWTNWDLPDLTIKDKALKQSQSGLIIQCFWGAVDAHLSATDIHQKKGNMI